MKPPTNNIFRQIKTALARAQKIAIISHSGPDGDTIGSNSALRLALEQQAHKQVVSVCADEIPERFLFIPLADTFQEDFKVSDFDLIIAVDVAAKHMLKFHETKPELLNGQTQLINIDHHHSNEGFGTLNLIQPDAPAVAMIIYDLLVFCGFEITPEMATCLLSGIYYDTGGLKHSNTTVEAYKVAAKLIQYGANPEIISQKMFRNMPVKKMKLWGRIFDKIHATTDNIIVSSVHKHDFISTQTEYEDLSGIVEYLNMIPNGRFCVMLSEDDKGRVKGSMRTLREDVDLSEIAGKFGGGGHKQASGFAVPGELKQEIRWKVINENGEETYLEFKS